MANHTISAGQILGRAPNACERGPVGRYGFLATTA
jgi:hypothetical protein